MFYKNIVSVFSTEKLLTKKHGAYSTGEDSLLTAKYSNTIIGYDGLPFIVDKFASTEIVGSVFVNRCWAPIKIHITNPKIDFSFQKDKFFNSNGQTLYLQRNIEKSWKWGINTKNTRFYQVLAIGPPLAFIQFKPISGIPLPLISQMFNVNYRISLENLKKKHVWALDRFLLISRINNTYIISYKKTSIAKLNIRTKKYELLHSKLGFLKETIERGLENIC